MHLFYSKSFLLEVACVWTSLSAAIIEELIAVYLVRHNLIRLNAEEYQSYIDGWDVQVTA